MEVLKSKFFIHKNLFYQVETPLSFCKVNNLQKGANSVRLKNGL